MLDLPGPPRIDKSQLIGGCLRLPLTVEAARLATEVAVLPASLWGTPDARVGVHRAAEAIFLRGHAPAAGELPIEDRAPLALLPCVREIVTTLLTAPLQRCLLARLPGGAAVDPHIDQAPCFAKTLRIHGPVETHGEVWMLAGGQRYHMAGSGLLRRRAARTRRTSRRRTHRTIRVRRPLRPIRREPAQSIPGRRDRRQRAVHPYFECRVELDAGVAVQRLDGGERIGDKVLVAHRRPARTRQLREVVERDAVGALPPEGGGLGERPATHRVPVGGSSSDHGPSKPSRPL